MTPTHQATMSSNQDHQRQQQRVHHQNFSNATSSHETSFPNGQQVIQPLQYHSGLSIGHVNAKYGQLRASPVLRQDMGPMIVRRMSTSSSSSGSGDWSGDFSPIQSPVLFNTHIPSLHLGATQMNIMQQQAQTQQKLQAPIRFGSLPPQIPQIPNQNISPDLNSICEQIHAEVERQKRLEIADIRGEFASKAQLSRVRIADLEERLRLSQREGDEVMMKLMTIEVKMAEAENTRDTAVGKLENIVRLIKETAKDAKGPYVTWLEAELELSKAKIEMLEKREDDMQWQVNKASQEVLSATQANNAVEQVKKVDPEILLGPCECDQEVASILDTVVGTSDAERCTEIFRLPQGVGTEEAESTECQPPVSCEVNVPTVRAVNIHVLINRVMTHLKKGGSTEDAVRMVANIQAKDVKQFVTRLYIKGISMDTCRTGIEKIAVAVAGGDFITCIETRDAFLEGVSSVSRQLGDLRKHNLDADETMAGYAAASLAARVVTAKQFYDAMIKGAGKKRAKQIAILFAHTLKMRLGTRDAATLINMRGGLKMGHVAGLEWLGEYSGSAFSSPDESDYNSRSVSAGSDNMASVS